MLFALSFRLRLTAAAICAAGAAFPQVASQSALIDSAKRTVTTSNFTVSWNTGPDTEAITNLQWMGGANLTGTLGLGTCGALGIPGDVAFFGNSNAVPGPGGSVSPFLVGGGTVTPPGETAWSAEMLASGTIQVTINSNSTNCPPTSASVNVQTTYRFYNAQRSGTHWFGVQRVFDFSAVPFTWDFRAYVTRLDLDSGYTDVLYPTPSGGIEDLSANACAYGCTGPKSEPEAAPLKPIWDSAQGWFAIHNPETLNGMVVRRAPSGDSQGKEIATQLWVDNDFGPPASNASAVLLLSPAAGFGGLVVEAETLCFYDSTIWIPSTTPPVGCRDTPVTLSPWTLTFGSQPVGSASLPLSAKLTNSGSGSVKMSGIHASGDFSETDDCPPVLGAGASCTVAVVFLPTAAGIRSGVAMVLDELHGSPQVVALAGLGLQPEVKRADDLAGVH